MKIKKSNLILIIFGIIVFILGIILPLALGKEQFAPTMTCEEIFAIDNYGYTVNIKSEKELHITSATVNFDVFSNKIANSRKNINVSEIFKTQSNDKFIYTFTISLTQSEFMSYIDIASVEIETNLGDFTIKQGNPIKFNWKIPVIIFSVVIGASLVVVGVFNNSHQKQLEKEFISSTEEYKKSMQLLDILEKTKQENNMHNEHLLEVCEYCGTENESDAKKCVFVWCKNNKKKIIYLNLQL